MTCKRPSPKSDKASSRKSFPAPERTLPAPRLRREQVREGPSTRLVFLCFCQTLCSRCFSYRCYWKLEIKNCRRICATAPSIGNEYNAGKLDLTWRHTSCNYING